MAEPRERDINAHETRSERTGRSSSSRDRDRGRDKRNFKTVVKKPTKRKATTTAIKQTEKDLMAKQKRTLEDKRRKAEADARDKGKDKRERQIKVAKGIVKPIDDIDTDLETALSEKEIAKATSDEKKAKERDAIRKRFRRKGSLNLLSLTESQKLG